MHTTVVYDNCNIQLVNEVTAYSVEINSFSLTWFPLVGCNRLLQLTRQLNARRMARIDYKEIK